MWEYTACRFSRFFGSQAADHIRKELENKDRIGDLESESKAADNANDNDNSNYHYKNDTVTTLDNLPPPSCFSRFSPL